MVELPDYNADFPIYAPVDLTALFPKLDAEGIDLVSSFLRYPPEMRISAEKALLRIININKRSIFQHIRFTSITINMS